MDVIRTFLSSIGLSPPGGRWSFMYNKRNSFVGGIGLEFFVNFKKCNRAALLLMRQRNDLKGLSVAEVSSLLKKHLEQSLNLIGIDGIWATANLNKTLLDFARNDQIVALEKSFDIFLNGRLENIVYCMPIKGVSCVSENTVGNLSWVPGNYDFLSIAHELGITERAVKNGVFPPIGEWKYRTYPMGSQDSWFIVRTNDVNTAESCFRRMAGALSVILEYRSSRLITAAETIDGRAFFRKDGTCGLNTSKSLIPSISDNQKYIAKYSQVFWKLCSDSSNPRLQTCLEFLSESWSGKRIISFINASIAMDALYGENGKVRKSILAGVEKNCNISNAKEKYDLILSIRNDVLHGDCATLELSPHYLDYYDRYENDPAQDQLLILNNCLISMST